ncbi:tail protein [Photorhabdus luminescens subsp. luminescens]|uniref:p2-like prophage tail protein X n=1 Tax=Photorhabdus luminescens TaxID=29488 RepID=A0A1G5QI99_PHOLU|nr:tail protein X [Photorhabdus luminescens]KMW71153.1 tail protein [Photorhabdus luminescens subsp. luminescens]SCZ61071.1 P2-like prophage tail protein X [Photorhabdus luminescens]
MEVKALQGDTIDMICQRYYGRTQGVVEAVLNANNDICHTTLLCAGQFIILPDFEPLVLDNIVQLWD